MNNYLIFPAIAIFLTACVSNEPAVLAVPSVPVASASNIVPIASASPIAATPSAPATRVTGNDGVTASGLQSMSGMLEAHNRVRAQHSMSPLAWSGEMANYAKEWANHLAGSGCGMTHRSEAGRDPLKAGENIYWGGPVTWSDGRRDVQKVSAANVADAWASEKADYNYQSNSCAPGKQCGHYTQMVWKATTHVGCGAAMCPDKGQIWVCSYNPTGNWIGQRPY